MVYIFLAEGFEEIEAVAPCDVLRRAQVPVSYVSVDGPLVTGAHGITIKADLLISEVDKSLMSMLVLPGGMPGTTNLWNCSELLSLVQYAHENNKYLAAICAAPLVFGRLGLLKGKNAICFPGFEDQLEGANISKDAVVVDQNIITARSCCVSIEFGLKLAQLLLGKDVSSVVQ